MSPSLSARMAQLFSNYSDDHRHPINQVIHVLVNGVMKLNLGIAAKSICAISTFIKGNF